MRTKVLKKRISYRCVQLVLLLNLGVFGGSQAEPIDPELTTHLEQKEAVFAAKQMAVTANPYASQAAMLMLRQGGSAVDAAIAAQMVLTLVEPQSSGIGGGAFLLHYDATSKTLTSFDGRETAPLAAKPERFLKPDGSALSWRQAWGGGLSVGVPGVVAMLELAHQRYGKLEWNKLFQPAIKLATEGFTVSPRLAGLLAKEYNPWLKQIEPGASYFYPKGQPLTAGTHLKNTELAHSLQRIAHQGKAGFYQGELAQKIVQKVQQSPLNPGDLSLKGLASYKPVEREPLCYLYREFNVCGMAPPSSGGLAVAQILALLEPYNMRGIASLELNSIHLFTQASRLAFADRNLYVGDSDFISVPLKPLLSADYTQKRARLISKQYDMGAAKAGQLAEWRRQKSTSPELPNTSHLTIVDAQGNVLSMTTSIEMAFGSGLMVGGFLLNNQLTDFSFTPIKNGVPVANAVQAGKRPRSSMAPVIVLDSEQKPYLALGSPGGSRIINYVAQTLLGVLDGGLTIQQAINFPKVTNRNDYTALEQGAWSPQQIKQLKAMGHHIKQMDLNSGLHGIQKVPSGWLGGADPRREGVALGD